MGPRPALRATRRGTHIGGYRPQNTMFWAQKQVDHLSVVLGLGFRILKGNSWTFWSSLRTMGGPWPSAMNPWGPIFRNWGG
jgi:hypothetical protein